MIRTSVTVSFVLLLILLSGRQYVVASAQDLVNKDASTATTTICQKVVTALAKIAQNQEDDEEIRVSAISAIVEIYDASDEEPVNAMIVDALIAVVENVEESSTMRSAAIEALLDLVERGN